MITLMKLAQKVLEMREAQKKFFRERTQTNLTAAKKLEEEVDGMLLQLHCAEQPQTERML